VLLECCDNFSSRAGSSRWVYDLRRLQLPQDGKRLQIQKLNATALQQRGDIAGVVVRWAGSRVNHKL
jgi:hypothetical protein